MDRHFCGNCGSALWVYHDKWPDLVHPFASAIDTRLAGAPRKRSHDARFQGRLGRGRLPAPAMCSLSGYPDKSIEVWHDRQIDAAQGQSHERNPFFISRRRIAGKARRSPRLRIVDDSWYLPAQNRNAQAEEFEAAHIPGAVRFDIDAVSDKTSGLPHMLPSPQDFAAAVERAWHFARRRNRGL